MGSKICLKCKKDIVSKFAKKFCSRSCSISFNNLGHQRNKKAFPDHPCKACGKKILWRKMYCNHDCKKYFHGELRIRLWLDEKITGVKGSHFVFYDCIREYLLKKSKYRCSLCGWSKINLKTNKVPLQVDHIDGNYMNNAPSNIRILCPNCHSLTETFGALNLKGRGRRLNGGI